MSASLIFKGTALEGGYLVIGVVIYQILRYAEVVSVLSGEQLRNVFLNPESVRTFVHYGGGVLGLICSPRGAKTKWSLSFSPSYIK